MKAVFADTYFYLALVSRDASERENAERAARESTGQVVTTDWVIVEVANALADQPHRAACIRMIDTLRGDPLTHVIAATPTLFERGWTLYVNRPDQDWSLTDCISFMVMKQQHLTEALTGDHHFEQAGFAALLRRRT